jgi:hypothetical protein
MQQKNEWKRNKGYENPIEIHRKGAKRADKRNYYSQLELMIEVNVLHQLMKQYLQS